MVGLRVGVLVDLCIRLYACPAAPFRLSLSHGARDS